MCTIHIWDAKQIIFTTMMSINLNEFDDDCINLNKLVNNKRKLGRDNQIGNISLKNNLRLFCVYFMVQYLRPYSVSYTQNMINTAATPS